MNDKSLKRRAMHGGQFAKGKRKERRPLSTKDPIHLEIEIAAKNEFKQFLRSITCLIARKITSARKGKKFGKFWDHIAFTRIVRSFTERKILERYIMANQAEAIGGPLARAHLLEYWFGQRELLYG